MRKNKRGAEQRHTGGAASTFIFILGFILLLYILFLPPEDRQALLDGEDTDGDNKKIHELNNTLVHVKSLHIDYLSMDKFEHTISPFYLFLTTNAKQLYSANNFYIKNNWFNEQSKVVDFSIDDLPNTKDVKLSFNVDQRKGKLKIVLNGNVLYEDNVDSDNVGPIKIEKDFLERDNRMVFEVSDVGGKFWETNEYSVMDLGIYGKLTDKSKEASTNIVTLADEEIDNLETATMKFYPNCEQGEVGKLTVYINDRQLFSQVPDCSMLNRFSIPKDFLEKGRNKVTFRSDGGRYLIDQLEIETELSEETYPLYYFDIPDDLYDDIQDGDALVNFSVEFVDDNEYDDKTFELSINGHITHVDTREVFYNRIFVKDWIEEGTNYIKIIPKSSVDIVELNLEVEGDDYYDGDEDSKENCIKRYRRECYKGDVWWYDSCGDRSVLAYRCGNDEDCEDGSCVTP